MSSTSTARLVAVTLVLAVAGPVLTLVAAQDTASEKPQTDEPKKWAPVFHRHASEYVVRVTPTQRSGAEARWLPEPVLRWWQPVRGGDDGALYLWLHDGRPVAAITFFTFKWPGGQRAIVHERHSFSLAPIEAEWRGGRVWHAERPGVAYQPVPGAPRPADSTAARLRQMQGLAREFSAVTVDDKAKDWPLRLLPKPLYRYEGATADSLDGALFALAQGTDPEAFLLLDARGAPDARRWEFAVARFTDRQLIVRHKSRDVYRGSNTIGGVGEIYHSNTVAQKPSDRPEDFP